ncbi:MAG: ribokinase [Chloroflexota bacterium]|nr:ribokinase [Chloroflexota bacterium]
MKLDTPKASISILGALNMDLIMNLDRPANPGETVVGDKFYTAPGGKGGNQAVAAARVSNTNSVKFLGFIGNDNYGIELKSYLENESIITSSLLTEKDLHSGIAIIFTTNKGENYVNAVYGANEKKDLTLVESFKKNIESTKILITQNELDEEITRECMNIANKNNIPVILDPAPFRKERQIDYYQMADFITPNETEAELMTGIKIINKDDAIKAAKILISKGIKNCVITLGENGAFYMNQNEEKYFNPHKIKEVKASVAAGDAFTGIMGASLAAGEDLNNSIGNAIIGSALSVTKYGAQESMPYFDEIIKAKS